MYTIKVYKPQCKNSECLFNLEGSFCTAGQIVLDPRENYACRTFIDKSAFKCPPKEEVK